MTDNTQPESLRIADDLEASSHFPGNMRSCNNAAAAELRRQHARIAELESELEAVGAGGVQALSAASPPAEQQAATPEADLGGVYAELPDFDSGYESIWNLIFKWEKATPGADSSRKADAVQRAIINALYDFADRTHALRMQAAPKAAPGDWTEQDALGILNQLSDGPFGESDVDDALDFMRLVDAARRDKTAPQQEAQEPATVPYQKLTNEIDLILSDSDTELSIGAKRALLWMRTWVSVPLYTAPQPAPAPLSEMPYEKRKAIQEGEQIGASDAWFKARHEMLDTVDRRNVFRAGFDRGWNAALAAQGGK